MITRRTSARPTSATWESQDYSPHSLTPLDGRNFHKLKPLAETLSEFALHRQRLRVEIAYLLFLREHLGTLKISSAQAIQLKNLATKFDEAAFHQIRSWEKKLNHDVKAVEYYLKDKCHHLGIEQVEMVHWALTSEDVNNLSYQLNLQAAFQDHLVPLIQTTIQAFAPLLKLADQPMLARTHGQPAQVTTLAKELAVFVRRWFDELRTLVNLPFFGKCNGAVGTYADWIATQPNLNWPQLLSAFVKSLGLTAYDPTTQLLPYDGLIRQFDSLSRLNQIGIDACQNLWWYISLNYLTQHGMTTEIGSSIMPQKVNPIYLEGAEGGFEVANSLFAGYRVQLSTSRLQRDLSDSTIRRSFGMALGYTYLSFQSVIEALQRLIPNTKSMAKDLEDHYEILSGPVQNYLRYRNYQRPYELLTAKVKGQIMNRQQYLDLLKSLPLTAADYDHLLSITFEQLSRPCRPLVNQLLSALKFSSKTSPRKSDVSHD